MIPAVSTFLENDITIEEQPTRTYYMNLDRLHVRGYTDEQEAIKQAIFKILSTERYQYLIYSWNYGIETIDLFGEPVSYVCPELERRITEALLYDTRIQSVDNFEFQLPKKGVVYVTFTAHTIFGDVEAERTVNI